MERLTTERLFELKSTELKTVCSLLAQETARLQARLTVQVVDGKAQAASAELHYKEVKQVSKATQLEGSSQEAAADSC